MPIEVLIVDDHAVVRDGLRLLLESHPDIVVVGEAANGRDAVAEAQRHRPDVVLLDIAMRDLNGIEAARQIREQCPATQIVMLSMHANEEYIARALQAGALGYVLKEAPGAEVVAAINTAYTGGRFLSEKVAEAERLMRSRRRSSELLGLLSDREREVLQLLVEGRSSAQIAGILMLSPKTVETYRSRLRQKLRLSDVPSLVKFAIQHGLTPLE